MILITYKGGGGELAAETIHSQLSESGIEIFAGPNDGTLRSGRLGIGEVVITIIISSAVKVALGMAFDALEKAILEAMERHENVRMQIEVKHRDTGEKRRIPIVASMVAEKAIVIALRTAKEIVEKWCQR